MRFLSFLVAFLFLHSLQAETLVALSPRISLQNIVGQMQTVLKNQGVTAPRLKPISVRLGIYEISEELGPWQIQSLQNLSGVKQVSPNISLKLFQPQQNHSSFRGLWGLENLGLEDSDKMTGIPGVDVSARNAWKLAKGKNVIVGVVDSGVDISHPQLKNSLWVNRQEAQGQAGVDDDKNGYVDDIHGYDFVNNKANGVDKNKHGTHVSGTIAAQRGSNGHQGVSPGAKVMSLKIFNKSGRADLKSLIKAFDYALDKGVRIYNHSWGVHRDQAFLREVFHRLDQLDVLNVVAAGNYGMALEQRTIYPAAFSFDSLLTVAATDHAGNMAWYSSWSPEHADVGAPGHRILSTLKGGGYKMMGGTSMAAPHVTGVAALLASHYPEWSAQQIKKRIMNTVKPLPALKNVIKSEGMVSAYDALTNGSPESPVADDLSQWKSKKFNLETRHPYWNSHDREFEVHVPGAKRIAVFFERFELHETDHVKFNDPSGWFSKPRLFGVWKNDFHNRYSPIVEGDTMVIDLHAGFTGNDYGFRITHVIWQ